MDSSDSISRRRFLRQTCGAMSSIPAVSTLLNLRLANYAAADTLVAGAEAKTLVAIHLPGGMDGYNLLIPRDDIRYANYLASRTNLAVGRRAPNEEPAVNPTYRSPMIELEEEGGATNGDLYGVNPGCSEIAEMFNGTGPFSGGRRLSFVSNVGSLIRPLTLAEFNTGLVGLDIPVGITGHARQSEQWQTTLPQGTVDLNGWLGRAGDLVQSAYNRDQTSMNLSVAGNNLLQIGNDTRPFTYSSSTPLGLTGVNEDDQTNPLSLKNLMHRRLMSQGSENYLDDTFSEISNFSLDQQLTLKASIDSFDESTLVVPFPATPTGRQLKDALVLIATREAQGLCRQSLFVTSGSWDNHFDLPEPFYEGMRDLSEAISAFQQNLDALGLADSVISFTTSEFARTLRSTGAGSDHAWGGPQMIFGGPIEAGKVFGRYPDLTLDSNDDIGRGGRILPSSSCDEYFADMLRWFGITEDNLSIVLPNYGNFSHLPNLDYLKV